MGELWSLRRQRTRRQTLAQQRSNDALGGSGRHGAFQKDQRIGLHVIADRADGGAKRRQIDFGIDGLFFDIEPDLDDDDIGLAENARVGDGDEIAGDLRRLGSSDERSIGRREGKRASIEGRRPLTAARGRQIDADNVVEQAPAGSRAEAIAMALAAPTKPRPCTRTILRPCLSPRSLLRISAVPPKITLQFHDPLLSGALTSGASTLMPSPMPSSRRSARGRIEKKRRTMPIVGRS
jgi:hypothetical protein